jgi:hypothetical protein
MGLDFWSVTYLVAQSGRPRDHTSPIAVQFEAPIVEQVLQAQGRSMEAVSCLQALAG